MDELLKTLVLGAPNLMVAIYVLWRQEKRIETLLAQQDARFELILNVLLKEMAQEAVKVAQQREAPRP